MGEGTGISEVLGVGDIDQHCLLYLSIVSLEVIKSVAGTPVGAVHCGYFPLAEKLKTLYPRPEEDTVALFIRAPFPLSGLGPVFFISLNSQVIHFLLRQTHSQV